jgi:predicted 2-oxoglutarate/Fe(II)-dependent dioxygenase YbiX
MANRAPRSAKQLLKARRAPIALIVEKQRERLVKIDARIGRLMTQRADEEEILSALITEANRIAKHGAA